MELSFDATVLGHNPDAVLVLDPAGMVLHWNLAAEAIFGYSAAEALGKAFTDLVVPADSVAHFNTLLRRAEVHGLCVDEAVRRRKDGSSLHVSSSAKAVRDADAKLRYFVLTKKDVTQLKLVRDTKLVQAKYRDLLEDTPDAILIVNVTGLIVLANAQAQQLFGYAADELIGLPIETLLPERYRRAHLGHRGSFFEHPRKRSMGAGLELYGQRHDGKEFPVEISLSPLQTEEGVLVMCAMRDITDRQEARSKADRKFRDLLESAPDAMVIVDQQGRIVLVNSQAVHLFGWTSAELLGQPVETLVPLRYRGDHHQHRLGFSERPKMRQMGAGLDLYGLRKNGSEFPVEISLSPIETEEGLLVASAIRDASDRKRIEHTLQEASRLKSEFLAGMSHELRTPLNGILGFSELLADKRMGPLNQKQAEYIGYIHQCGKHLLQLINDVLDLSKVESGKMEVHADVFSIQEAIASVCAVVMPSARKKHIQLVSDAADDLPQVTLDSQKVKQILFNLLSNAVKFTDDGGSVRVSLEPDGDMGLRLTVRDSGIGISIEDQARLFEAFRQLEGGLSRHHEGTGLGLALTRKLVELQGGRITVQSAPGSGSTFSVWLPRTLPAQTS
jgi:protein-histidine pros-kinase